MAADPHALSSRTLLLAVVLAAAILGPYAVYFFSVKPAVQLISLLALALQVGLHRLAPTHLVVGCFRVLLVSTLLFSSTLAVAYQGFIVVHPPMVEGHPVMPLSQVFGGLVVAGLSSILVLVLYLRRWRRHPSAPVVLQRLLDLAACVTLIVFVVDVSV